MDEIEYDAVIVGGGPAGLSAALVLGRARLRVLVLDAGRPANRVATAIGGLLGRDGSAAALRRDGRRQLRRHPNVRVIDTDVLHAVAGRDAVEIAAACTDGVACTNARALLLATGLDYRPPEIPGLAELWGRSVFHCAFCDGWEVAGRPIALHARGAGAARLALLLRGWSDDVLLCTDGPPDLAPGEPAELADAGVRVREEPIERLESDRHGLRQIVFAAGPPEPRAALFVRPERSQPSALHRSLALELRDDGLIDADPSGRTSVPRVYAAGDAAAPVRSVAIAIGSGSRVGTAMAADLLVDGLSPRAQRRADLTRRNSRQPSRSVSA